MNGEFVTKQDALSVSFLVVCELLSKVAKQEVHQRRPKTDLRIVQSDRSFRTNKSDLPIRLLLQDQQVGSANQSVLYGPTSVRANQIVQYGPTFCTDQSDLSYGPTFRTDQSDLSCRPTSVQTNQIFPTEPLSVQTNQIFPRKLLSVQTNQI